MVLPVHDENPTRRTPVVTYLLIAVNVVVFLISPVAAHVVGSASEDELKELVRQRVARFAVPREFRFLASLPRNATGKIVKRELT